MEEESRECGWGRMGGNLDLMRSACEGLWGFAAAFEGKFYGETLASIEISFKILFSLSSAKKNRGWEEINNRNKTNVDKRHRKVLSYFQHQVSTNKRRGFAINARRQGGEMVKTSHFSDPGTDGVGWDG